MGRIASGVAVVEDELGGLVSGLVRKGAGIIRESWNATDKERLKRDIDIATLGLTYTGRWFVGSFSLWKDTDPDDMSGFGAGMFNMITGAAFVGHGYLVQAAYTGAAKRVYEAIERLF